MDLSQPEQSGGEPATVKVKLTIAYDGTNYEGWQLQKIGLGVQQKIEEAFERLFRLPVRLHSSSRTDAGVHALGMVAHAEIPKARFKMTPDKLALALNAHLPEDIRIMSVSRCRPDFHARFDASGKQYRYFVWNARAHNPLLRHTAWFVPQDLDLTRMRAAAKIFVGKHDFEAFAATREYKMKSTVRTLFKCEIKKSGPLLAFVMEGDGFLYKMCRGIVGTLVQVGQGKYRPEEIRRMLNSKDRRMAGMTAPASGLVLWKVFYNRSRSAQGAQSKDRGERILMEEE